MQSDLPHTGAEVEPSDFLSKTPAQDTPSSSDELTDEEWAELERATDPDLPPDEAEPHAHGAGWVQAADKAEAVTTPDPATPDPATPDPATEVVPTEAAESMVSERAADLTTAIGDEDVPETVEGSSDETTEPVASEVAEPEPVLAMPLPRIIAVANQKGGVGKTTTTVNIAACLAEQGYRTLLVDLDPQANASTGLGLEPRELEYSIYHVMLHDQDTDSCIEPTEIKNLFVLPSSLDLAGAEIELVSLLSREHRLRLAIDSVIDDFDYVLIDCPPSLGLLTINALTAAHEVLVPIQCEYYALEGLGQLMRNVDLVKASLNPDLVINHIVLVMFDPRTRLAGQVVDEVRSHFGKTVCENVIPRTVRLSENPSFGQPITTFDSDSRGAAAYRAVTQEVLNGQA